MKLSSLNSQLKNNVLNGICLAMATNLVNPYYAKYALRLGATDYDIALLSSLPALIAVFSLIPGAILIDSSSNKQKLTGYITLTQKIFFLLCALVPFLSTSNNGFIFVIIIGLMNLPGSIGIIGYQSIIGDVFSMSERNHAMSIRSRYSDIFRVIVVLITGQLLQIFAADNEKTIFVYQLLFIFAFIISLGEVYSVFNFKSKSNNTKFHSSHVFLTTLKQIRTDKHFLSFLFCSVLFHFGWQMGWPLFSLYQIKYLGADEGWLSMVSLVASIASILAVTHWSKFADKYGNSISLTLATFAMSITPIIFIFTNSIASFAIANIIPGVATAGMILILFNIMLEVTPTENRTIYIAIHTTLTNISATISPIIGIWIKDNTSIYMALFIVGVLRLIGSISFFIRNKKIMLENS